MEMYDPLTDSLSKIEAYLCRVIFIYAFRAETEKGLSRKHIIEGK